MEEWALDWEVPDSTEFVEELLLPDPGDRHVLAAVIAGNVPTIVTHNLTDFPSTALAPYGIRAIHPDAFVNKLMDAHLEDLLAAVRAQRIALRNPPRTADEHLERMQHAGLGEAAARLAAYSARL